MLIAPLIRREAEQSSRNEGTQTTFEQLLIAELAPAYDAATPEKRDDRREVMNYVRAME
jgi:Fic family protein